MEQIILIIFQALAILFGIVVHESAHAWSADRFGDPTARLLGRVTLNPIPHIDPIGTILVPAAMILFNLISHASGPVFGWAKPVPVNPYNLRHPKRSQIWISAAGPASNLLVATVAILLIKFALPFTPTASITALYFRTFLFFMVLFNVFLAVFNLIPIPPLDGSGILEGLLNGQALRVYQQIKPYGFFILLFIFYSRVLDFIFNPIIRWIALLLR